MWWERGCGGSYVDYFCTRALVGDAKARGKGNGVQPGDEVTGEVGERYWACLGEGQRIGGLSLWTSVMMESS